MSAVYEGPCGAYKTTVVEHEDGLLVIQDAVFHWEESDQVILSPEALEAIKEWLEDTE